MQRASFEYAVHHLGRHGDTDVFPFPPENHVFHDRPADVVRILEETHANFEERLNVDATGGVSSIAPVGYTGFRWVTQLDPLWNAYLLALVIELAPAIENVRVSPDIVHSHRFSPGVPDYALFERDAYLNFETASCTTAADFEWVVSADIADFYPRIYHHRLDNMLREVSSGSDLPSRVMSILKHWSSNTSYGLPVGGPAARLLSELLLTRSDKLLLVSGLQFHRYADDYRLFASTKQDAHRALVKLADILLRNEGLALTKAKTRIMSRAEFLSTVEVVREDREAESELTPAQVGRQRRARELLGLTLRYDPYSPTAVHDFEALKEAVARIDIVDLFMMELSKPRIDPRLTRKLLRALEAAEPSAKGQICSSLVQNLELLAPLIPQVMQAVRKVLGDLDVTVGNETRRKLAAQIAAGSHVLELGGNRAFAIRIMADGDACEFEEQLAGLFDGAQAFLQRDIIIAMARWGASYWISDKRTQYDSFHPWVKRALLMASYSLGDEGKHWRDSIRNRLSQFDLLIRDWVADRVQVSGWQLPL
jgi:hypothetical protein